jgi:hypothetical protein
MLDKSVVERPKGSQKWNYSQGEYVFINTVKPCNEEAFRALSGSDGKKFIPQKKGR